MARTRKNHQFIFSGDFLDFKYGELKFSDDQVLIYPNDYKKGYFSSEVVIGEFGSRGSIINLLINTSVDKITLQCEDFIIKSSFKR